MNRVLEQEELGLCLARVSSLHRAKWEKGPGEAGALVLSWMVNEAAEKGDQISWLCKLKAQIRKRIALLGGFSHPILWGFVWSDHKRQHLNKLVGRPQRVPPKDCLLCSSGIQDGQASRGAVLTVFPAVYVLPPFHVSLWGLCPEMKWTITEDTPVSFTSLNSAMWCPDNTCHTCVWEKSVVAPASTLARC